MRFLQNMEALSYISAEMNCDMNLSWISRLVGGFLDGVLAFLTAILPERIKETKVIAGFQSNAAHVLSGITECLLAPVLFVYGYDQFIGGLSAAASHALATHGTAAISESQLRGIGVLGYIMYFLHPAALGSFYLFGEGFVRAFAAGLTGRRYGIGILWAIHRIAQFVDTKRQANVRRRQLGSGEPDFLIRDVASGALILVSLVEQPWRERQVAQCGDDFYILSNKEFVLSGRCRRHRYTFRPMHPGEIIRGTPIVFPAPAAEKQD